MLLRVQALGARDHLHLYCIAADILGCSTKISGSAGFGTDGRPSAGFGIVFFQGA